MRVFLFTAVLFSSIASFAAEPTHSVQLVDVADIHGRSLSEVQISKLEASVSSAITELRNASAAVVMTSETEEAAIEILTPTASIALIKGQSLSTSTFTAQSVEVEPSPTDNGFEVYFHLGDGLRSVIISLELSKKQN